MNQRDFDPIVFTSLPLLRSITILDTPWLPSSLSSVVHIGEEAQHVCIDVAVTVNIARATSLRDLRLANGGQIMGGAAFVALVYRFNSVASTSTLSRDTLAALSSCTSLTKLTLLDPEGRASSMTAAMIARPIDSNTTDYSTITIAIIVCSLTIIQGNINSLRMSESFHATDLHLLLCI